MRLTKNLSSVLGLAIVLISGLILMAGCQNSTESFSVDPTQEFEIAFMPDVHFHDIFADFEPGSFEGLPAVYDGDEHQAVIRTMEAQLNSTRLFNENYFALLAALENAANRGIKHIALPGDFSDDGQPAHVRGLVEILEVYRDEYDISFYLTPGNHDPGRPFTSDAGKRDYLGEDGKRQPVFSSGHPLCAEEKNLPKNSVSQNEPEAHPVACTDEVKELGYGGLFELIGDFGLAPDDEFHYYETPFSGNQMYQDELPSSLFDPENRMYEICHEGSGGRFREDGYTNCFEIMDMSYLAEPVEGLWLLALDTNVYIPREDADTGNPDNPDNFSGSGNAGYNKVVTHKKHVVEWMTDVAKRAAEHGKTLISFSHFPATDFYNGAGPIIERIWGEDEFQLVRLPTEETTNIIVNTGVGLHIAGHMHMNGAKVARDTVTRKVLTNIQAPSLAAYVPAYKIVRTFAEPGHVEIETVTLSDVPGFDTLFSLYEQEWDYLNSIGYQRNWNREILDSENYLGFTDWHIRELSRLRFLPGEWPEDIRTALKTMDGRDLLIYSQWPDSLIHENDFIFQSDTQIILNSGNKEAIRKASELAENAGYSLDDFSDWDGTDLSVDFYRIRNAGGLALQDISTERFDHYSILATAFSDYLSDSSIKRETYSANALYNRLGSVFHVMSLFSNRLPDNHVRINLQTGEVINLSIHAPRISAEKRQ